VQTLYETVQDFTPAQRDLIAFILIDCRASAVTARFLFATRMPDGQLHLPSRIAAAQMARRQRRGLQSFVAERFPPVEVELSPAPSTRAQVAELHASLLLGRLTGTHIPAGPWSTPGDANAHWRLMTHSGSQAERDAWLRGESVAQAHPGSPVAPYNPVRGAGARGATQGH
jgi:hypothetical protein